MSGQAATSDVLTLYVGLWVGIPRRIYRNSGEGFSFPILFFPLFGSEIWFKKMKMT